MAGRGYDVVQVLARERSLRERAVSAGDRRALGPRGAGGTGPDRTSGDAADRCGDPGRHRADVVARVQVLRSPRGRGVWSDHDSDWHRDLHSLEVQAIRLDLVDQGRARDSELHRGPRAVPGVMSQGPFDLLPFDFRQRLRRVAAGGRGTLSQINW